MRTIFGAKTRPHRTRVRSSAIEAVIETPRYDLLTGFNVTFGRLAVKAYTKGEHVLRFEAIAHNTKDLNTGRVLDKFPDIVTKLGGITERFSHRTGLRRYWLPRRRHPRTPEPTLPNRHHPPQRYRPE